MTYYIKTFIKNELEQQEHLLYPNEKILFESFKYSLEKNMSSLKILFGFKQKSER